MLRKSLFCISALALVVLATNLPAQTPSPGGTGMQFVPVDTGRNLAAPVPNVMPSTPQQPKKGFFGRVADGIGKLNPFRPKTPPATNPTSPTTQLPKNPQTPAAQQGAPGLPTVTPVSQKPGQ
jgi:hypothetical protein